MIAKEDVLNKDQGVVADIPYRKDWIGTFSKRQKPLNVIAKTQKDWRNMWKEVGAPEPFVLPYGYISVGIFLGSRPTGGYGVEISNLRVSNDRIRVDWRETRPHSNELVPQVITSPYALKLIPFTHKEILFLHIQ